MTKRFLPSSTVRRFLLPDRAAAAAESQRLEAWEGSLGLTSMTRKRRRFARIEKHLRVVVVEASGGGPGGTTQNPLCVLGDLHLCIT